MGMLEDDLTEYKRTQKRDAALVACVKAMREVQDFWGDPGSYIHNRLETPLLVHAETISAARGEGMSEHKPDMRQWHPISCYMPNCGGQAQPCEVCLVRLAKEAVDEIEWLQSE